MAKPGSLYMALMIPVFADLAFGKEMKYKNVCSGDSIQLFDSIKVNDSDTIVSLYINGENDKIVATLQRGWPLFDHPEYVNKLGLDGDMNLWILNVNQSDKGRYTLLYKGNTANSNFSVDVELSVVVPPASTCKPEIRKLENNNFYATVKGENCGKPRASAYWLNYSSGNNEHRDVIKLQDGQNLGTYYACIEGPALSCARSSNQSMNHCQSITIYTNSTQPDRGSGTNNIPWLLWVIFALQIILTVVFSGLLYILYIKKKKIKSMIFEVCSRCIKKSYAATEDNTDPATRGREDDREDDENVQMLGINLCGESDDIVSNDDVIQVQEE